MTKESLSTGEFQRFKTLADLLMPATAKLPAAGSVKEYESLVATAIDAASVPLDDFRSALAALPVSLDWPALRSFAASHPKQFETLSLIASGAYVMAPDLLNRLGFPAERRNPAGPMDAADEYETGILEPVVNRGPVFRDPRKHL